jgi:RNA polymerase sigma-B factor
LAVLSAPPRPVRDPVRPPGRAGADYETHLLVEFGRTRDPRLRAELIERHLPLARRLAARYGYSAEPFDDLLQVACIGLIKAIDR